MFAVLTTSIPQHSVGVLAGVWGTDVRGGSDPQQKPYRRDEASNTTPKTSEQYSWWYAGFCLPAT